MSNSCLSITEVKSILNSHDIEYKLLYGQLNALEISTTRGGLVVNEVWVDVTGWSLRKLKDWLGY